MLFKGFPVLKGLRYVLAQCIGAYVACLVIYVQYRHVILVRPRRAAAPAAPC